MGEDVVGAARIPWKKGDRKRRTILQRYNCMFENGGGCNEWL
jgi:hypothetical protein